MVELPLICTQHGKEVCVMNIKMGFKYRTECLQLLFFKSRLESQTVSSHWPSN